MTTFIDLSHDFEDGMPGFRLKAPDGSVTEVHGAHPAFHDARGVEAAL